MNTTLFAGLMLALLLCVVALAREVRLRRALERLLRCLLSRVWRRDTREKTPEDDPVSAGDRADRRV